MSPGVKFWLARRTSWEVYTMETATFQFFPIISLSHIHPDHVGWPETLINNNTFAWTSLVAQWLRLHASKASDASSVPGQGAKIPPAAQHSQKERKKEEEHICHLWCLSFMLGPDQGPECIISLPPCLTLPTEMPWPSQTPTHSSRLS